MWTRFIPFLVCAALLAAAQTVPLTQNALTNKDIVTLTRAGFNEDFIVEAIQCSRTQFDTSVKGLAELAHEGLTERIIRVMMNSGYTSYAVTVSGGGVLPGVAPPSPEERPRTYVLVQSPLAIAVHAQTPYYQSSSIFWGLFRRKAGVGTPPRSVTSVAQHLGPAYQQVRPAAPMLQPLVGFAPYAPAPAGQPPASAGQQ